MKQAAALAAAGATLVLLAGWAAWPAVGSGEIAIADPPSEPPATAVAPLRAAAAAAAAAADRVPAGSTLLVRAGAGTPAFGVAHFLRRPAFAPSVRFDAELWEVFARGPRGDLAALEAVVFDRLARLGHETVDARTWSDGATIALAPAALADASLVVALSAHAVGYARLGGAADICVDTTGAAELRAAGDGELWAWSDGAFVGPHGGPAECVVPASRLRALAVVRAPALRVRFFDPVEPSAGALVALAASARVAERVLVVEDPLLFGAFGAATQPQHMLALHPGSAAGASLAVREEGDSFGCYFTGTRGSPVLVSTAASRAPR